MQLIISEERISYDTACGITTLILDGEKDYRLQQTKMLVSHAEGISSALILSGVPMSILRVFYCMPSGRGSDSMIAQI